MDYSQMASFWIGAVVILIYALERFNSPPTNRPSTTWLRYYSAAFVYVGLFELTYVLLCYNPELLKVLKGVPGFEELGAQPEDPNNLYLSVSTLFSVLVPKIPGLSRIDLEIRHQLQRVAAIPTEARRFAREIQRSSYQPDHQLLMAVRNALRERGLEGAAEPEQLQPLRRLIAMMLRLHEWESDLRFAPFLHERDAQYDRLRSRYQRVMEMTRGYLALPPVACSGASAEPASQRFLQAFDEETLALLQEGSELISHSLLKCCLRAVTREQELTHMGLVCRSEPQLTIDVDQLTLLFGALIALLTLYVILVFRPQLDANDNRMFVLLAKIPLIYTLAMICAVLPKQHWRPFQRRGHAHIPAFGYLLSGLMAATAAVLVSLLIDILLLWLGTPPVTAQSWGLAEAAGKAWGDYWARRYPFMLLPFTAAATMAFIIDWQWLQRWGRGWQRRLADAAAMALAMGLAGWLVHALVLQLQVNPGMANRLWAVVMLVVMIGALLGALVPNWFRQHSRNGAVAVQATIAEPGAAIIPLVMHNSPVGKTNA